MMMRFDQLLSLISQTLETEFYQKEMRPFGLYEPVKYILNLGGKRIRPVSALMAANLFVDDVRHLVRSALALEVFHNFTLLHDDIMDNSPVRRGQQTVHIKYGTNTAILSGDAMAIMAYRCLENTPLEYYPKVMRVFNDTSLKVCEGQQLDMEFENKLSVSLAEYTQMIRLKTAELLAGSLKIGALMGGASDKDAELLYQFGIYLGIAFQMKDDWLDTFGNFEVFGKRIGNDIIENKKTFLLLSALEQAKGEQALILKKLITEPQQDLSAKVHKVTAIFKELGIDSQNEQEMMRYYEQAIKFLDQVSVDNLRKDELRNLAKTFVYREK